MARKDFLVRPPQWFRLTLSTRLRFRNDTLARVVRRIWVGPVIVTWLPPRPGAAKNGAPQ